MTFSQRMEPFVSICIPMYNAQNTIGKTIASIIGQTYKNIEIIVVDNSSSDDSIKIVQTFNDTRLRLIQNDTHLPCAEDNWNRCFQYFSGRVYGDFPC